MKFIILYHISEDHDSEKWPNAYTLDIDDNKKSISLLEIRNSFPLEGVYEFCVKQEKHGRKFWLDLGSDEQNVPITDYFIELKVFRLKLLSKRISPSLHISPIKAHEEIKPEPNLLDLNIDKKESYEDLLYDTSHDETDKQPKKQDDPSIYHSIEWNSLFDQASGRSETLGA